MDYKVKYLKYKRLYKKGGNNIKEIENIENKLKEVRDNIQNAIRNNDRNKIRELMKKQRELTEKLTKLNVEQEKENEVKHPRKECSNKICTLDDGSKGLEDPYLRECESAKDLVLLSDKYCYNKSSKNGVRKALHTDDYEHGINMFRKEFTKEDYNKILGETEGTGLYNKQIQIRKSRKHFLKSFEETQKLNNELDFFDEYLIPYLERLKDYFWRWSDVDTDIELKKDMIQDLKENMLPNDLQPWSKNYIDEISDVTNERVNYEYVDSRHRELIEDYEEIKKKQGIQEYNTGKLIELSYPDLHEAITYIQQNYFYLKLLKYNYKKVSDQPELVDTIFNKLNTLSNENDDVFEIVFSAVKELVDDKFSLNNFFSYQTLENYILSNSYV